MSYSYAIPYRGTARVGWMLRGWQLAGSGQAHTGQPFTPSLSNVNLGLGGSLRPDRIAKGTLSRPTVQEWFDANAFPMLPNNVFRMGTSGRNILDAPGLVALNFSLSKNARIRERQIVQFRWEVFNAHILPQFCVAGLHNEHRQRRDYHSGERAAPDAVRLAVSILMIAVETRLADRWASRRHIRAFAWITGYWEKASWYSG